MGLKNADRKYWIRNLKLFHQIEAHLKTPNYFCHIYQLGKNDSLRQNRANSQICQEITNSLDSHIFALFNGAIFYDQQFGWSCDSFLIQSPLFYWYKILLPAWQPRWSSLWLSNGLMLLLNVTVFRAIVRQADRTGSYWIKRFAWLWYCWFENVGHILQIRICTACSGNVWTEYRTNDLDTTETLKM